MKLILLIAILSLGIAMIVDSCNDKKNAEDHCNTTISAPYQLIKWEDGTYGVIDHRDSSFLSYGLTVSFFSKKGQIFVRDADSCSVKAIFVEATGGSFKPVTQ